MQISPMTLLRAAPLAITLVWLGADSPAMFAAEGQFALEVLLFTVLTRSIDFRTARLAFAMGVGVVAPLVTLVGSAALAAGIDVDNGAGNWLVVPVLEEALKLMPVAWLAWRHRKRTGLPFNASDWFVVAAFAGIGFAMVENAYLAHHDLVYRYGPQIGPLYLFPTAWGYAGYLGHGAGTAFVGLGIGVACRIATARVLRQFWWVPAAAAFGWITLEHGLANMFYSENVRAALLLGAGRATPIIFIILLALVVAADAMRARSTWQASARLQRVFALLAAAARARMSKPADLVPHVVRLVSAVRLLNRVAAMPRLTPAQEVRT